MRARIVLSTISVLLFTLALAACGDDLARPPVSSRSAAITAADAGPDATPVPGDDNGIGTSPSVDVSGHDDDPTK